MDAPFTIKAQNFDAMYSCSHVWLRSKKWNHILKEETMQKGEGRSYNQVNKESNEDDSTGTKSTNFSTPIPLY